MKVHNYGSDYVNLRNQSIKESNAQNQIQERGGGCVERSVHADSGEKIQTQEENKTEEEAKNNKVSDPSEMSASQKEKKKVKKEKTPAR